MFHLNLPKLSAITKKMFPILHTTQRLQKVFPDTPLHAYRRPKNLRDLLVHAELSPPELSTALGSTPCGSRRCLTCKHITPATAVHRHLMVIRSVFVPPVIVEAVMWYI